MANDMWDYAEAEAIKRGEEAKRQDDDLVYQAHMRKKRQEEFDRGVRLGWWDAEGNPIEEFPDDEEEEDDA